MEDDRICELFWQRTELAICELDKKYGRLGRTLAGNILSDLRDTEECVNDALLAVWNAIPPERPTSLKAYFCRIVKNQAVNRLRYQTTEKRDALLLPLEELVSCGRNMTEETVDAVLLGQAICAYLADVSKQKRDIFILRYWYHTSIKEIARMYGFSQSKVKSLLLRMRRELCESLEKEGILI